MEKKDICIIAFPSTHFGMKDPDTVLYQFLKIFEPNANKLFLISGFCTDVYRISEKVKILNIKISYSPNRNIFFRILYLLFVELRLTHSLIKIRKKNFDTVVFIGTADLIIPILATKLIRKKSIYISLGESWTSVQAELGYTQISNIIVKILYLFEKMNFNFADKIIVYSQNCITPMNEEYQYKINVAYRHYLNFDEIKLIKRINERKNIIGYIGRFENEKGIQNFINAIPLLLEKYPDMRFILGGDGSIRNEIEKLIKSKNLSDKVDIVGWISRNELAKTLNEMKLCVLPSKTEGIPNVMLESMGCGTLFLATPNGGIKDIIKDGENGFLLENDSAQCIYDNVIRIFEKYDLDAISDNAYNYAHKNFTYERSVNVYNSILNDFDTSSGGKKLIVTTSWDDGNKADLKVIDLLDKYGLKGTFYVPVNLYKDCLDSNELRKISKNHEIGAHTVSHKTLTDLPENQITTEINDSKQILEKEVKNPIKMFCYPNGKFNKEVIGYVRAAGFIGARTTDSEKIHPFVNPFIMNITTILSNWSPIITSKSCISNFLPISSIFNWEIRAKNLFDIALKSGGIYHIYGHSLEIDEKKEWDKLESLFRYISSRKNVKYMTNGEICELNNQRSLYE